MAYIGKEPAVGNFVKLDAISTSSTNTYNLTLDSVAFTPESANHMLVSLNGVIQAPQTSFSVSGSTITFLPSSGTLSSSDSIDFIMVYGNVLDIGTPSDSTVTNAKTNFVSTSSAAGLQIKGDNTTAGTLQLNCEQNSHGIKLRSPAHSSGQSYTMVYPTSNITAGKFLKVDSVSGSGATGVGQLSFADAGGYTQSSVLTPTGATIEFTGLPSGINNIIIKSYQLQWAGSPSNIQMQLGDSGGFETSGYESIDFFRGVSAGDMGGNTSQSSFILAYGYSGTDVWSGVLHLHHVGSNRWVQTYTTTDNVEYIRFGGGVKTLSAELTQLKLFNQGGTNADGGYIQIMYQ